MRRSPTTPNITIRCFDCGCEMLGSLTLQGEQDSLQGAKCPACGAEYVLTFRRTGARRLSEAKTPGRVDLDALIQAHQPEFDAMIEKWQAESDAFFRKAQAHETAKLDRLSLVRKKRKLSEIPKVHSLPTVTG